MKTRTNHGAEITLGTTESPAVAPAAICSAWLDLPDREGWWWKHFGGDEAAHVIRVTAQEVESMRKWGDWRGKGIVIHYLGPIPEPALPNDQAQRRPDNAAPSAKKGNEHE